LGPRAATNLKGTFLSVSSCLPQSAAEKNQSEILQAQAAAERQIGENVRQRLAFKAQNSGFEAQFFAELEKPYSQRGLSTVATAA
jgi:hypothetical protein